MVTVSSSGTGLDAYVQLPSDTLPGSVRGLDGTDSGNLANEFSLPDGTVLAQPLSYTDLYTTWANAWCVTPSTSLMDYGPGQPTATFTDPNFPGDATAISSLPANVVQNAENLVAQAGITDPTLAHDALDDYLFTGDPTFIQGALDAQSAGMGPIATATNPAPRGPPPASGRRRSMISNISTSNLIGTTSCSPSACRWKASSTPATGWPLPTAARSSPRSRTSNCASGRPKPVRRWW
jgi:hypothetical protein